MSLTGGGTHRNWRADRPSLVKSLFSELLRKQRLHSLPRVFVCRLVVFHARKPVLIRAWHREAVDRAGVGHEFVFYVSLVKCSAKCFDCGGRNERIVGAVTDQYGGLDLLRLRIRRRRKCSMKGGDGLQI